MHLYMLYFMNIEIYKNDLWCGRTLMTCPKNI